MSDLSTKPELERLHWEIAALTGRMRSVELERDSWRARCDRLVEQRDREREKSRKLADSGSYRLGRALVSFARDPWHTSPRLVRGLARRLRPAPAGSAVVPGQAGRPPVAPRRPAHLYVAIGLDHDALRDFLVTVNQRLLVTPDHRPVVLTDDPAFALLRKLGVLMEYLPDRATWERHRPDRAWDDLLAERLAQLCRDHNTERTVVVDRLHPPALADLLNTR
ncbi:hypothetical protein ACWT_7166 [Actinoplanes sp. SE50]|uniref:hypothetical protein n=1 Tax=unclassified Actinoplanes TaxID=2626549 RepID=UPI00023EDE4C|nr:MULTISPECIES: hypothetical protein [unclassified Actinoplanes]AEV88176.1 hypothetical protein ACPL_7296 [Actinoplanes sp. SE50/110]ATO86581.1 hypothetical protein ACWT_7166 [Actinoplanes sp. SE50]SLM03998.1 hypothetical protein ACSP50_7297 [Actinoplanes sp. SE50/110]